jgi:hypothetical protein
MIEGTPTVHGSSKPRDVVMFGPQWQLERYSVLKVDGGKVHYKLGPMRAVLTCTLQQWREWSAGGEVIERSE